MTPRSLLITKYVSYQQQGLSVFTVSLSTYIQEQLVPPELMFQEMWDNHFIHKVRKRLPMTARLDHDYVIELSPPIRRSSGELACFYGYHGFLAIDPVHSSKIWTNGFLNRHLVGSLKSLRKKGLYRPFCINSFLIEPVTSVETWSAYITKTSSPVVSFA
jgi:hypothetical protein